MNPCLLSSEVVASRLREPILGPLTSAPPILHQPALKRACEILKCKGPAALAVADMHTGIDACWRPGELFDVDAPHLLILNGLTLGRTNLNNIVWHELTHAAQSEQFASWLDFFHAYTSYPGVRRRDNAFEYEAYANGDRFERYSLLERDFARA